MQTLENLTTLPMTEESAKDTKIGVIIRQRRVRHFAGDHHDIGRWPILHVYFYDITSFQDIGPGNDSGHGDYNGNDEVDAAH